MECGRSEELGCCLVGYILIAAAMIDRECMRRYASEESGRVRVGLELRHVLQDGGLNMLTAASTKGMEELAEAIASVAKRLVGRLCGGVESV